MIKSNEIIQKDDLKAIVKIIKKHQSFSLFCHINPDGDAIGSVVALRDAMRQMGKEAYAFCDDIIPENLTFLGVELDTDERKIESTEVMFMLDCNSLERIGKYSGFFEKANIKCKIDHHQQSIYKFDYDCTQTHSASTCDIVYELLGLLKVNITPSMAQCLYTGISTDTGCFKHESTTPISHKNSSELMQMGFDYVYTNKVLFKHKKHGHLEFIKFFLNNTKSYLNGNLYITAVDNRHYKEYEHIIDSTAFDFLDGIDGNEVRVRIFEKERGALSCAIRSNNFINVCKIAKAFGGGGHIRASGFQVNDKKKNVIKKLLEICKKELELNN